MTRVLAIDIGASSGRAIIGAFNGKTIELEEVHRFENIPITIDGTLYWDTEYLLSEIQSGIAKAGKVASLGSPIQSIGVDTWGVDFALCEEHGMTYHGPVHYRDERNKDSILDKAFKLLPRDEFYKLTGVQFMPINTVFQLLTIKNQDPHILEKADKLLMMPDLFNYFLTWNMHCELSIASTTQMLHIGTRTWSYEVMNALDLPRRLLPPLIDSGRFIGKYNGIDVIAVCGHDTQCAIAAVPAEEEDFIYISCGTWSLVGTELGIDDGPCLTNPNLTNEVGYGGKITLLKNIDGLYAVQELRKKLGITFAELEKLPETREIYENLAKEHAKAVAEIKEATGKNYKTVHVVGGGAQSELLCQLTANACGMTVKAGPVEATALGNIGIQLITSGNIPDISTLRRIIATSCDLKTYEPT
jgi:rhamnulokinase/L-fuculokinase